MAATGHERFADLHGFLVIDKPAGWTSHDVVGRVRRLAHTRKVGHAGTLDPAATGVLPVAVGLATRVVEYLADASKTYVANITFGVATDSFDGDGRVTAIQDAGHLSLTDIEAALTPFRGPIAQLPPMHSAIKIGGKRLYEAARRGESVERPLRHVTIFRLELLGWEPPTATLLVDCSKGTYIRSLAADMGALLETGAYLSNLVRTRTGPFQLCESWSIAELDEMFGDDPTLHWARTAIAPDRILAEWPCIVLDETSVRRWQSGREIAAVHRVTELSDSHMHVRAYDASGQWLGVGMARHDITGQPAIVDGWQPTKVIGVQT